MKPDAKYHNPAPDYIRELVARTGLTREEIAAKLGISLRALDNYRSESSGYKAPYTVQYALEALARKQKRSEG